MNRLAAIAIMRCETIGVCFIDPPCIYLFAAILKFDHLERKLQIDLSPIIVQALAELFAPVVNGPYFVTMIS
jgi:hypothetical protein